MFQSQLALALRVLLLYPLAGLLAALPSVNFDQASGVLSIDLTTASTLIGTAIWLAVSGGTFGLSRLAKTLGWAV
ncbi:hypothetical protein [Rhodobacter lacus]|uniref:Uncharacterized protein n=1 Tax=Rhodobacter lacus TaxID=1641972 RepID=A0ABW5A5D4_9RHOB